MLRSILMGLVAGQRSMMPLAAIAGTRPNAGGGMAAGAILLAAGEIAGDKMKTAPDRTMILGLIARALTGGFGGAALAAPDRRRAGAALGATAAVASSYVRLAVRKRAMRRWGQTATGFVEDAMLLSAATAIVRPR